MDSFVLQPHYNFDNFSRLCSIFRVGRLDKKNFVMIIFEDFFFQEKKKKKKIENDDTKTAALFESEKLKNILFFFSHKRIFTRKGFKN